MYTYISLSFFLIEHTWIPIIKESFVPGFVEPDPVCDSLSQFFLEDDFENV